MIITRISCCSGSRRSSSAQQELGSLAILADGVGGESNGDVASCLAAETALAAFKESDPEATPTDVARQMFDAAAAKVFQAAQEKGRMATTLLASIYRQRQGHGCPRGGLAGVSDPGGKIKRLTTDHSYTALQVKLGLAAGAQRHDQPQPLHSDPEHRL